MLWEAVLLGLAIGWFRKGSSKNLNHVNLIGWPIIILALLIQAIIRLDFAYFDGTFELLYSYFYVFSFVFLLVVVFLQEKQTGIIIFGLGILLNLLVITANEGRMPVNPSEMPLQKANELSSGTASPFHTVMDEDSWLAFLGDHISLPYSKNRLISIGDIILGAGIAIYIQHNMLKKNKLRKWR
ncbi:MAG: hypothetical protein AVO34_00410 [Firmicutes bacterium ML8_F2]|nr:MAG: hypothetical protein AVO34_00410 [Firmicutes bacterium ML8_F2]